MYDDRPEHGLLERVLERLDALERENETCRAETARLACELSEVRASATGRQDGGARAAALDDHGAGVSRRGMLRLGAAAGAAATASALVGAQPALAGTDGLDARQRVEQRKHSDGARRVREHVEIRGRRHRQR